MSIWRSIFDPTVPPFTIFCYIKYQIYTVKTLFRRTTTFLSNVSFEQFQLTTKNKVLEAGSEITQRKHFFFQFLFFFLEIWLCLENFEDLSFAPDLGFQTRFYNKTSFFVLSTDIDARRKSKFVSVFFDTSTLCKT